MRAGPKLRVAKAARAPPCTLPILGRRLHFRDDLSLSLNYITTYLAYYLWMNKSVKLFFQFY